MNTELDRRTLLKLSGAGAASAVLGYAGYDRFFGEIEAVKPNGDGEATDGEFRWLLEQEVAVETMTRDGNDIEVTYTSESTNQQEFTSELVDVVSVYAKVVKAGYKVERVNVTVKDAFDANHDGYHIKREWVMQYLAGNISSSALVTKVYWTSGNGRGEDGNNTTAQNSSTETSTQ